MGIELSSGFDSTLGFDAVEAGSDRVVLAWDVQPVPHHQPDGVVHGGVYAGAAQTAATVGAALWFEGPGTVVAVSNHTDFLQAVRSGRLTAIATPIHRGRSQQLWLVEITDDQARLVARGQVRLQNLSAADSAGSGN